MDDPPALAHAILDAIDEPALIARGQRTIAANRAALALLGQSIVDRDLRFAIRHPLALDTIAARGDADIVGIGSAERPWHLRARGLVDGLTLILLSDRSQFAAAERMRTDFVANASHELRTPLATIIGYSETLAEDGPLGDELRIRFGATIQSEARRMLRIVEDLMSLSRIEADRFRSPGEIVDLGEVARLAVEHAGPVLDRQLCKVALHIARPAPVRGDFAQLLQLADNLIGNALRYGCPAEGCEIEVAVSDGGNGRQLLVVRDHGQGMEARHLPRLTERFYRVDAARSRDGGGTGLGLAIVKHIVERHRGTIEFLSAPGEGTEVQVRIDAA